MGPLTSVDDHPPRSGSVLLRWRGVSRLVSVAWGRIVETGSHERHAAVFMAALFISGCQAQPPATSTPTAAPSAAPTLQPPAQVTYDDSSKVPWVLVANGAAGSVEIRLWDGAMPYISPCGTKQGFPKATETVAAPQPPWHLTVRDAATGRLLAERLVSAGQPGQFVWITHDQVSIGHTTGVGSGPAIFCYSPSPGAA